MHFDYIPNLFLIKSCKNIPKLVNFNDRKECLTDLEFARKSDSIALVKFYITQKNESIKTLFQCEKVKLENQLVLTVK